MPASTASPISPTSNRCWRATSSVDAVALCMPPGPRHAAALTALEAGKHVLLEKPPGATVSEARRPDRSRQARKASRSSRPGIRVRRRRRPRRRHGLPAARSVRMRSTGRRMCASGIRARPGSGSRVGSACSIPASTRCRSSPKSCRCRSSSPSATLMFPQNRAQPIAADLIFADSAGGDRASATFDWRQTGPQTWDIRVITDDGELLLQSGGSKLFINGEPVVDERRRGICRHLQALRRADCRGGSDVDFRPLRHVADAFMAGPARVHRSL